eukprot:355296-Chlamydomonas_euryale.AAC.4
MPSRDSAPALQQSRVTAPQQAATLALRLSTQARAEPQRRPHCPHCATAGSTSADSASANSAHGQEPCGSSAHTAHASRQPAACPLTQQPLTQHITVACPLCGAAGSPASRAPCGPALKPRTRVCVAWGGVCVSGMRTCVEAACMCVWGGGIRNMGLRTFEEAACMSGRGQDRERGGAGLRGSRVHVVGGTG